MGELFDRLFATVDPTTRLTRHQERQVTERETLHAILDDALTVADRYYVG